MFMDNQESQESPTEELPLSGTSSVTLWDDLSDNTLLTVLDKPDEELKTSHNDPAGQTEKILQLAVEECTTNGNIFSINYTDKDLIRNTRQRNDHSDEESSSSCINQENNLRERCNNDITGNQSVVLVSQTEVNQNDNGSDKNGNPQATCDFNRKALSHKCDRNQEGGNDRSIDANVVERALPIASKLERDSSEDEEHTPAKRRKVFTPFQMFRGKYLNVTDLTSQAWCEQALVYSFTRELPEEVDTTGLDVGSSIHLARELEVHDVKSIAVTSQEDKFSVKLLNMLTSITALASGSTAIIRELPVFGLLPNSNMFVSGIIDEIRYNEKGELQLIELKTKKFQREPSRAQYKTHTLQVMVYKHLFDCLVRGSLTRHEILTHLGLDGEKPLGKDILDHGNQVGLEYSVFGDLLDLVILRFRFSDLPLIDSLKIEYCYQATCELFATRFVEMDVDWLNRTVDHYLKFWNGSREAEGVDVEEAWKCKSCPYYEGCEWVEKKTKELTLKNKKNTVNMKLGLGTDVS